MRPFSVIFYAFVSIATALFTTSIAVAQAKQNILLWNREHKLTVNDFEIKTGPTSATFAQFSISYQVAGFDFWKKNFNKSVRNCIIKSASSIDTASNVKQTLLYQQTLFDIAEIYARQFRKGLRENRKKILKGNKLADDLNNQIMTDFSRRRLNYDQETHSGTLESKQGNGRCKYKKNYRN